MITASEMFLRAARIAGGRTGTLGTVTHNSPEMGSTTVILNGLVNVTGDPQGFPADDLLMVLRAGTWEEAQIRDYDPTTGAVSFIDMPVLPVANDTYMVWNREDYQLAEIRDAFDKALYFSRRTYRQVVPLTPNLELYPLSMCDWLEGAGDIDAAWLSTSPVMLHNEDMSLWQDGKDAAPDGYMLTDLGTGATIERQLGGMRSAYKAHIVAGSGIVRLTQTVPDSLVAWASGRTQTAPVRYPIRPWAWASTPDANAVRAFVFDGTTYHYTDYFDASTNGLPVFKEAEYTPAITDTAYTWGIEIAAGAECDLHVAGEVQNTQTVTLTYSLKQQGSQAFKEVQIPLTRRNMGGLPTIELPNWPGAWYQLIVYVRRNFPAYSSDEDSFDDQYARLLVAGTLRYLLEASKPNQDRTRLDRIQKEQAKDWTRFLQNTISLPVPTPLDIVQQWGA